MPIQRERTHRHRKGCVVIGKRLDGDKKVNWVEGASCGVMERGGRRRRRNCLFMEEDLRGIDRTSQACE